MTNQVKIKGGEVEVKWDHNVSPGDFYVPEVNEITINAVYITANACDIFDSYDETDLIYEDIREALAEEIAEEESF